MDAMKYYGYKVYVADEKEDYNDSYYDRGVIVAYDYSDAIHKLEADYEGTSEIIGDVSLYELSDISDRFSIYEFLCDIPKETLKLELRTWELI